MSALSSPAHGTTRAPSTESGRRAAAARVLDHMAGTNISQAAWLRMLPLRDAPPPPAWHALAGEAAAGGGGSGGARAALRRALAPRRYQVPHFGTTAACRCRLTGTATARRFRSKAVNAWAAALFGALPGAVAGAGGPSVGVLPSLSLSRWDLHHAHLFASPHHGLGLLFHAKEYPAACPDRFPAHLGFCQLGSPLPFDPAAMDWRNLVWARGRVAALDLGPDSALHGELLMDGLHEARTVLEADFGEPLAELFWFEELRARKRRDQHHGAAARGDQAGPGGGNPVGRHQVGESGHVFITTGLGKGLV